MKQKPGSVMAPCQVKFSGPQYHSDKSFAFQSASGEHGLQVCVCACHWAVSLRPRPKLCSSCIWSLEEGTRLHAPQSQHSHPRPPGICQALLRSTPKMHAPAGRDVSGWSVCEQGWVAEHFPQCQCQTDVWRAWVGIRPRVIRLAGAKWKLRWLGYCS